MINTIVNARKFIKNVAYENTLLANFKPKPFLNAYGSAMHFNISLHKQTGENIFSKDNYTYENQYVQYIVAGILGCVKSKPVLYYGQ